MPRDATSDVESGITRFTRRMQRVHSIVSGAISFTDDTSAVVVTPEEDDLTELNGESDLMTQLRQDTESPYQSMSPEDREAFAELWDPVCSECYGRNSYVRSKLTCKSKIPRDLAVGKELKEVQGLVEEKLKTLDTATDIHVGESSDDRTCSCIVYIILFSFGQPRCEQDPRSSGANR